MRDIIFRGKRFNDGAWVEGGYACFHDTTYCFKEDYERNPQVTHHFIFRERMTDWGLPNEQLRDEVDPETVGEYVGIKDKHGCRIFEGDVVNCRTAAYRFEGYAIRWSARYARYVMAKGDEEFAVSGDFVYEIIGNIHEHKEAGDVQTCR